MLVPLKIRSIGTLKHKSGDFTPMTIYIPVIDEKGHELYVFISCKLYLVDELKINMLLSNNVLCIEG